MSLPPTVCFYLRGDTDQNSWEMVPFKFSYIYQCPGDASLDDVSLWQYGVISHVIQLLFS